MCSLCEKIEENCREDIGEVYICKCDVFHTYDLVQVNKDTGDITCFDIEYCPKCGRKLNETL